MNFLISDSFTDSLARLTDTEQKAVKTTAFELQLATGHQSLGTVPGMSFHKLDRVRDKNFWSVRVSSDLRLIVHRTTKSLLLCYVDHHDQAYEWASRRKLETHPQTGAAQLVEIRERVEEIVLPQFVAPIAEQKELPLLFGNVAEDELLNYGVPQEWVSDVMIATEDTLFTLTDHLPAEAAEALLELATGGKPSARKPTMPDSDPFDHPDAQRRFRVMANQEELQRALEFPWDKWSVFLHPEQKQWVERDYSGPARVAGTAGTGKTVVALHRAVFLARVNDRARVLLTTFSDALANDLQRRIIRLIRHEPLLAEQIEVYSLLTLGKRLHRALLEPAKIAPRETIIQLLQDASAAVGNHSFTSHFLLSEWEQVVDAWQLESWEAYRDVIRLGRKTRLAEPARVTLWAIFEKVREGLAAQQLLTEASMFNRLAAAVAKTSVPSFDFVVVDEAQDIGVAHLRLFAAIGRDRPNSLFFAGDLGQRIFQQPFSWLSLGVDVRGRSRTLRVNYRTSHQIRRQADRLLDPELTDVDGNVEVRSGAISTFEGPEPLIRTFASEAEEIDAVAKWLTERLADGILPHECGLFVRSEAELTRAIAVADKTETPYNLLDDKVAITTNHLAISTMHLAKGLEFRVVVVMACDDEVIPSQERIESVGDSADLQEVYDTERHLLYVACTRARDQLLITALEPASEFLDDMNTGSTT